MSFTSREEQEVDSHAPVTTIHTRSGLEAWMFGFQLSPPTRATRTMTLLLPTHNTSISIDISHRRRVSFAPLPSPRDLDSARPNEKQSKELDSGDEGDSDEGEPLETPASSPKFFAVFQSDTLQELLGRKRRPSNTSVTNGSPPKECNLEPWTIPLSTWSTATSASDRGRPKDTTLFSSYPGTRKPPAMVARRCSSQDGVDIRSAEPVKSRRLLNGRVYKPDARMSDIGRPKSMAEPEFVEWGFSGLGSIGSAPAASSPLAAQTMVDTVAEEDDDDDGSGMGWVRKRRQQRERAAALLALDGDM